MYFSISLLDTKVEGSYFSCVWTRIDSGRKWGRIPPQIWSLLLNFSTKYPGAFSLLSGASKVSHIIYIYEVSGVLDVVQSISNIESDTKFLEYHMCVIQSGISRVYCHFVFR